MAMTWTPERAGNWLFHCHIMHHVSLDAASRRERDARRITAPALTRRTATRSDRSLGMAGMVIGVTVRDPAPAPAPAAERAARRRASSPS